MGLAADQQQQRMLAVTTADRPCAMLITLWGVGGGKERYGHRCDPSRAGRVRADVRSHQGDGADMSGADLFGLVVSLVVFGYLVYALMRGERL
jgi:hypothetical protein